MAIQSHDGERVEDPSNMGCTSQGDSSAGDVTADGLPDSD